MPSEELVHEVIAGYLTDTLSIRDLLDSRYDEFESGRVDSIDGESFFEQLRLREEQLGCHDEEVRLPP